MNKTTFILAMALVFLAACDNNISDTPAADVKRNECTTDADCVTGGCSGTICQSRNAEPIFTTCEWRAEYSCYKQISCKCNEGKCDWGKTADFDRCVEEARATNPEVVV